MEKKVEPVQSINGVIRVPGDKSISHRSIMLASISNGITEIEGFLEAEDCLSTISIFSKLGVEINKINTATYKVRGRGLLGLKEPNEILDVGNSGTTIRLASGILSGQDFYSVLTGDSSIRRRPMLRVVHPLREMGAVIDGRENAKYAPLSIRGGNLKGISYHSSIASAQVKSAILFAGLYAEGVTTVSEPYLSRNHTENMLLQFGAKLEIDQNNVTVYPNPVLEGQQVTVPGDFSSAAFFIAAALITPNSRLMIKNVGINPTRIGLLEIIKKMNGKIEILEMKYNGYEPVADIVVETSELTGTEVFGDVIPRIIDELPLLAVIASQAEGITKVTDAKELRVKETDRIKTIKSELNNIGIDIEELEDGFIIKGKQNINGGVVSTNHDHRIGMAMAIAGLIAKNKILIKDSEAINISYPHFFTDLSKISKY